MPWTKSDYPDSMKNLPLQVRNKAIDIANALLEEKEMKEGIANSSLTIQKRTGKVGEKDLV